MNEIFLAFLRYLNAVVKTKKLNYIHACISNLFLNFTLNYKCNYNITGNIDMYIFV